MKLRLADHFFQRSGRGRAGFRDKGVLPFRAGIGENGRDSHAE